MKSKAFDELEKELNRAEISMTPLIDMVFILLIFFVVTTSFTKETGITIKKAKAVTSELIINEVFSVAIDSLGKYWHSSQNIEVDMVVDMVIAKSSKNSNLSIVITPDKNSRVEPLITLMDKLRQKEITKFSIGTERVVER